MFFQEQLPYLEQMDSEPRPRPRLIITCGRCGEKITSTLFKRHSDVCRKQEERGAILKCPAPECQHKVFKTKSLRQKHINIVHDIPVKCSFPGCDVVMKPSSLKEHHKQIHENIKEKCKHCRMAFLYGQLSRHLKICPSDRTRPFKCTVEGCERTFKSELSRSNHLWAVHTPPVLCKVPNCGAVVKKASLLTHLKIVHKQSIQECNNCGKKITYGNLRRHLKTCKSRFSP